MKQKRKSGRKLLSFLLALALILGLMPGMGLTAYAATETYTNLMNNKTVVKFNNHDWYIIADDSTATGGTVTLLAADTSFGTSKFHDSSNAYSSSTVKGVLDALTEGDGPFASVKDAIADTNLSDVNVTGAKLYLLSTSEAEPYANFNFTGAQYGCWWLRSPGADDVTAAFVDGELGIVNRFGEYVEEQFGVRPALKLNLSAVTFSSESNTFSLKSSHTHSFNYSASGATITASCGSTGCALYASPLTLTLSAADAVYSGSAYTGAGLSDTAAWTAAGLTVPAIEYEGRGDTSYAKSTAAPTEQGTYTASITVDTDKTAKADFTIFPMELTITGATAANRAYDKDSMAVTISAVTFKDSGDVPVDLTPGENGDYTAVGAMTDANAGDNKEVAVTVTLKNANYSLASNTAVTTVNISKAAAVPIDDVEVSLFYTQDYVSESAAGLMPDDAGNVRYARGVVSWTGSVWVSDFEVDAESGAVTVELFYGEPGDTVTLPVVISSTNYADSIVNVVITLTDKGDAGVSISGVPAQAKTYGDADFTLTGSVTDAGIGTGVWTWSTSDDTVFEITPNGAAAAVKILKAGSATVTAKYESDTTVDSETTAAITVNTKTLAIEAKDQSIYVGDTLPTLSGADFYTVTGLVGEETLTAEPTLAYQKDGVEVVPDNAKAGSYDIVPSGAAAGENYSIRYTNGTLTIMGKEAAVVTIEPLPKSLTYCGYAQDLVTDGQAENGTMRYALGTDDKTAPTAGWSKDIPTGTDAGTYYVWYKTAGDGTHADSAPKCETAAIEKRSVALVSQSGSKPYDGTALTMPNVTGWEQSGDTGFIDGEVSDVRATGSVTEVSEGEVTNTITYTQGASFNANNYTIQKTEGKLKITPKPVTITAHSEAFTYDGTAHENAGYDVEGLADGDAVSAVVEGSITFPGESPVTNEVTGYEFTVGAPGNYNVTVNNGELTMVKAAREITITAASASWVYDGEAHEDKTVTLTQGELFPGDTLEAEASGSVTEAADTAEGNNPVAAYKIMHGDTDVTENYVVTAEAGTLTIIATPELSVTAPTFSPMASGCVQPAAQAITIENTGTGAANVTAVTLSGSDANRFTLNKTGGTTIAAGAKDTSYTIRPNAGLMPGLYTAVITVTYDGGKTVSASVSFTVMQAFYTGVSTPSTHTVSVSGTSDHGTLALSTINARAGERVTITPNPDAGYALAALTVKDARGNTIPLTANADGTYSFTMPDSAVTVSPVFAAIPAQTNPETIDVSDRFIDVPRGAWFHDAVQWAFDEGLMNGVSDTLFAPGALCTRGMVVTMLWRFAGMPAPSSDAPFTDVSSGAWYAQAVAWAYENGIIEGMTDDTFAPDEPVTREQLAVILYRFAQSMGKDFTGSWMFPLGFPDASSVSPWANEAMHWMVMHGIINGMDDGTLSPGENASRAQIAAMFMRFAEEMAK